MRYLLTIAAVVTVATIAEARPCGLFKGRIRHAVHRAVDVPFKAAAGVKATVKGPEVKVSGCPDGKCQVPAAPAKK